MKKRKRIGIMIGSIIALFLAIYALTNVCLIVKTRDRVLQLTQIDAIDRDYDAILVLGAGVRSDGTPSLMLSDRLLTALKLFEAGAADRIIVSGDHGTDDYDEVGVMKKFLIQKGVPGEKIFMDHAGFSTYDSLYRAKSVFGAKKIVIVTQKYHTYRALFDGLWRGIDCTAVAAPILTPGYTAYQKQAWYSLRESVARTKDVFYSILSVPPKFSGEPIPLSGSGDATDDGHLV